MKENLLDSFDNSKKKCPECKKYFKTSNKEKRTICFECGVQGIAKKFVEMKQKHPKCALPDEEKIINVFKLVMNKKEINNE